MTHNIIQMYSIVPAWHVIRCKLSWRKEWWTVLPIWAKRTCDTISFSHITSVIQVSPDWPGSCFPKSGDNMKDCQHLCTPYILVHLIVTKRVNTIILWLTSLCTYGFCPRSNILSHVHKFICKCWRCLQVLELPWSWAYARPSWWNSKAKCPSRSWRTWAEPKWQNYKEFQSWVRALTQWNWDQDVWGHWFEWVVSSNNWTHSYKAACLS